MRSHPSSAQRAAATRNILTDATFRAVWGAEVMPSTRGATTTAPRTAALVAITAKGQVPLTGVDFDGRGRTADRAEVRGFEILDIQTRYLIQHH